MELKEYFFRNSPIPFIVAHSASEIREREMLHFFHESHLDIYVVTKKAYCARSLDQLESHKIGGNKLMWGSKSAPPP